MEILINFIITMIIIISVVFILAYLEKRFSALFALQTDSPASVLLQDAACMLKLLIKEDYSPKKGRKILYFTAPLTIFCAVTTAFCLIPLGGFYAVSDSFPSAVLFIALLLIPAAAVLQAGYSSGREPLISAIRMTSNLFGYGIPVIISILAVSFMAGSLNINAIVREQSSSSGLFGWYFIPQIIGCIVFFICAIVLLNHTSVNFSKTKNTLISDYTAKYSGLKYLLFVFSGYALALLISAFFVCVYFGGNLSPFGAYILPDFLIPLEQGFWFILKIFLAIFFIILTKISLPKPNHERFLEFSYKILIPLSLINLNITILIRYLAGAQ